ncbi:spinster family MFS transporter [Rubrivirga marina]|uniref:MFS transporter n=1 Tax=Rubrivirga marina TaxID=1196024 RepID=A0A271IUU5_9BACT|nr:MFS transporter [Rubrivirga marina]PAP74983.1 MFS transporter [Rubrivirga marina]
MPEASPTTNPRRVLLLLFLANLLNFFDRTIPAILNEPIRLEWGLSDLQLGLIGAAFTLVYAIAGLPLGRLADRGSRTKIMGWGLIVWSGFTAANAAAWNFGSFLVARMGVGVGEASYAPASNALIGDLFPAEKRSRALGLFMLGLPLGLLLAFFSVGPIVAAFGDWRAAFVVAAVPGFVLAAFLFLIREPERGASEKVRSAGAEVDRPVRRVLTTRTILWIILSGITINFAAYAGNGFLVPMIQRYFGLELTAAAITTGLIVGVTGLIGLTVGGSVADRIYARKPSGRLVYGAASLVVAALATAAALATGDGSVALFAALFGLGWLAQYAYYTSVYPAIQDVVAPRLRATAVALYFAGMYLLGGAFGPVVVGGLSDALAQRAMTAGGATALDGGFRAVGLHDAMYLIPVALALTAAFVFFASRSFDADAARMERQLAGDVSTES